MCGASNATLLFLFLGASLDRSRIIVSGDSHRVTKILYLFSCDAIIAIW